MLEFRSLSLKELLYNMTWIHSDVDTCNRCYSHRFYYGSIFVGFVPFNFSLGTDVATWAFVLKTNRFLLLMCGTCCLLTEVAFVQLYEFVWVIVLWKIRNLCSTLLNCVYNRFVGIVYFVRASVVCCLCSQLDFSCF